MQFQEVEKKIQRYIVRMRDGQEFVVTGEEREKIVNSPIPMIEIGEGGIMINRTYITTITPNFDLTHSQLLKTPQYKNDTK